MLLKEDDLAQHRYSCSMFLSVRRADVLREWAQTWAKPPRIQLACICAAFGRARVSDVEHCPGLAGLTAKVSETWLVDGYTKKNMLRALAPTCTRGCAGGHAWLCGWPRLRARTSSVWDGYMSLSRAQACGRRGLLQLRGTRWRRPTSSYSAGAMHACVH